MERLGTRWRDTLRRWTAALVLLPLLALTPAAADVPGAEAPDFQTALGAWLADNDAAAIPAFAELAAEGNGAARILLALIDRMPETHGEWLAGQSRAERQRLMRAPDGRSWMGPASETVPLAAFWLQLWDAYTPPELAFFFAERGENRAAALTLLAHAARERQGFAALAQDPLYPSALRYLALLEQEDAGATERALAAMHPGDPQRARLGHPPSDEDLVRWMRDASLARPLAAFCDEACGPDAEACTLAAYRALGGYHGLLALGPPSETLVPRATWFESAKGAQSVARRIAILKPPSIANSCLARFAAP